MLYYIRTRVERIFPVSSLIFTSNICRAQIVAARYTISTHTCCHRKPIGYLSTVSTSAYIQRRGDNNIDLLKSKKMLQHTDAVAQLTYTYITAAAQVPKYLILIYMRDTFDWHPRAHACLLSSECLRSKRTSILVYTRAGKQSNKKKSLFFLPLCLICRALMLYSGVQCIIAVRYEWTQISAEIADNRSLFFPVFIWISTRPVKTMTWSFFIFASILY